METAIHRAYQLRIDLNLDKLVLDLEDMAKIAKSLGYTISTYENSKDFFKRRGLEEYASQHNAFAFNVKSGENYIFYSTDGQKYNNQIFAIAHEIGHIYCSHISNNGVIGNNASDNLLLESVQENEANYFAVALIAPPCILSHQHITSATDITKNTYLDSKYAQLAEFMMSKSAKKSTPIETELCKRFDKADGNISNRKLKIQPTTALISAAMVCLIALSGLGIAKLMQQPEDSSARSVSSTVSHGFVGESSAPTAPKLFFADLTNDIYYHKQNCKRVGNSRKYLAYSLEELDLLSKEPCPECNPE